MTLPVFLSTELPADLRAESLGAQLRLGPEVAGHAVRVRRMRAGEELQLIDGCGLRITALIDRAAPDSMDVTITSCVEEPAAAPELVLIQALAKQDRDLQAIEAATEVGVDAVVPWAAARSIAAWPEKKQDRMAQKWENTLQAAALQARRSHVPVLHPLVRGRGAAEALRPDDLVLVLHEQATTGLRNAVSGARGRAAGRIVLIVGPEGGITDEEIAHFTSAGAQAVRLGDTVLRASTAGPVGLALCQLLLGRWEGGGGA